MKKLGLLLTLLAFFLGACDLMPPSTSAAEHLAQAKIFFEAKQFTSASIELKNTLTKAPNNPQAHWLLGKLYVEMGDGFGAQKELYKARDLGVNATLIMPPLLRAMLLQREYSKVLEQDISLVTSDSATADLLASRGLAHVSLNNLEEAQHEVNLALELTPNSLYVLVSNARVSAIIKNFISAHQHLEKALTIDIKYAPAWGLLGDLAAAKNTPEEAIQAYTKALNNGVNRIDNAANRYKRALNLIKLKHYSSAQDDLTTLKKNTPNLRNLHQTQGMLYFAQKNYREASNSFELSLSAVPDNTKTLFFLGITLYELGDYERAKSYIARFLSVRPNHLPANKFLAQLMLKDKENSKTEKLLRPLANNNPNDIQVLNLLADSLLGQGKTEEAAQILNQIATNKPESSSAQMRSGIAFILSGEEKIGFSRLISATKLATEQEQVDADRALILSYRQKKRFKEAARAAEVLAKKSPKSAFAFSLLGLTLIENKQEEKAKIAFEKALQIAPSDPLANHNLALIALNNSNPTQARLHYQRTLQDHPKHLTTLLRLAELEASKKNSKVTKQLLEKAMTAHFHAPQPRVLLARFFLSEGKPEKAFGVLGDILENNKNNLAVLEILGEYQLASKKFPDAKSTFTRIIELDPANAKAHFHLAQAHGGLNNKRELKAELERSLKIKPDYVSARIALTRLLIDENNLSLAEDYLEILKESTENNLAVLKLDGIIQAKLGNRKRALAAFKKSFEVSKTSRSLLSLAAFLWTSGDKDSAIFQLEQWNLTHKNDADAALLLANYYLELDRDTEAERIYKHILNISNSNPVALNNLAWQLKETNLNQALAYAEKAYSLAPNSPDVIDTLAVILLETGAAERAHELMQKVSKLKQGKP